MKLAIKIDVDTDRGTRLGVPNLLNLFDKHQINATFLFSLGPDNTGRALKRVFRPGFLKKVSRTSVLQVYGFKTLLNGLLWPGPHISRRNPEIMKKAHDMDHEVGIHCYDHIRWQDGLSSMSLSEVIADVSKAQDAFFNVFHFPAKTMGAAGWQANQYSLQAYDEAGFIYGSDTRGRFPFYPVVNGCVYKTMQVPTTLPTLDELLGRPEYPLSSLSRHYISLLQHNHPNVLTIHAELEGMAFLEWFDGFLTHLKERGVEFISVEKIATDLLNAETKIPFCELIQTEIDGRSGTLATQGPQVSWQ